MDPYKAQLYLGVRFYDDDNNPSTSGHSERLHSRAQQEHRTGGLHYIPVKLYVYA